MSSNVVALYNVYNDAEMFEESINSIKPHVDKIVVADGAYHEFPFGDCPHSTDGTLDVALRHADVVRTQDEPWVGESIKRNWLLDQVACGDWCFRIDADEVVERFDSDCLRGDVVTCRMDWHDEDGRVEAERFHQLAFRKQPGLHYKDRDSLFVGDEPITRLEGPTTERILLNHFPYSRNENRLKRKEIYRKKVREGGGV